jgi:hypothetical protein
LDPHIAGGTRVPIYPKPNHTPATFTVLTLPVDNIDKATRADQVWVRFESHEGAIKTDEKAFTAAKVRR